MSAIAGSVAMGPYTPISEEWAHAHNLSAAYVAEHNQRAAERDKAERLRLEAAKSFPVEGMSGKIKGSSIEVWRTDNDFYRHESLGFSVNQCHFCDETKPALYISDDYMDMYVCRDCLGKMFGVLEAAVRP